MTQVANSGALVCRSTPGKERGQRLIQICTGAPMATYDEMSPTDRGNLFESLASLNGFEEGPKHALPDGTRYEYDVVLKRTVEITPSGERFPVALSDGKLRRASEKTARRKGAAAQNAIRLQRVLELRFALRDCALCEKRSLDKCGAVAGEA